MVGTHTNGTGIGGRGNSIYKNSPWKDPYDVVTMSFSNEHFGYPGPPGQLTFEDDAALLRLNGENRPVHADVEYQATLTDFLSQGRGWLDRAISLTAPGEASF